MLLRLISILYYLLLGATPFLMSSDTSEMFEFNKMMFIYGITISALFFYVLYYIFNRPKIRHSVFFWGFIIFLLSQLISTLFSIDKHTSFYGVYGRWNGGVLSLFAYGILAFIFFQTATFAQAKKLLQLSLIVALTVVLWGLPAKFGGDLSCLYFTGQLTNSCWTAQFQPAQRMFSTLGQPNWLGAYLSVHFFISLMFLLQLILKAGQEKRFFLKIKLLFEGVDRLKAFFYITALFLIGIGIIFTGSRSALIGIFVTLIIAGILFVTQKYSGNKKIYLRIYAIFLVLACTFFAITQLSLTMAKKVPDHLQITDSFVIRAIVWEGALKLTERYPLFGTGPETFGTSYFFVKPESHNRTSEWDYVYNKAHNEFLHILATTGVTGFLAYLFFVITAVNVISKKIDKLSLDKKIYAYGLLSSFIVILITNFFGFSTSTIQLLFFLLPIMSIKIIEEHKSLKSINVSWNLQKAFAVTFSVIFTFYLFLGLKKYITADRLYKQGIAAESQDDVLTSASMYQKAINERFEPLYYDKLSGVLAQVAFIQSFGQDRQKYQYLIKASIESNNLAISSSPKNILYWRTKAKNYFLYYQSTQELSDLKNAVESMRYTIAIAPTDAQSFYLASMFNKMLAKETGDKLYEALAQKYMTKFEMLKGSVIR